MRTRKTTCPACNKSEDSREYIQYSIVVTRTIGFSQTGLDVIVCPNCGVLIAEKPAGPGTLQG